MSPKLAVALLLCSSFLAACNQGSAPSESSSAPVTNTGPAAVVTGLSVTPDTVRTCDVKKGPHAMLRWDVTASGAEHVILTVQNTKSATEKRFGRGGPVGSKQTGPWLRPGLVFRVRNQDGNAQLASVTIQGVPCR
jgi:hypothetical protein